MYERCRRRADTRRYGWYKEKKTLETRGVFDSFDWNLFKKRYSRREHVLDRKNERDRERVFCCKNSPNGRSIQVHEAFEGNQA